MLNSLLTLSPSLSSSHPLTLSPSLPLTLLLSRRFHFPALQRQHNTDPDNPAQGCITEILPASGTVEDNGIGNFFQGADPDGGQEPEGHGFEFVVRFPVSEVGYRPADDHAGCEVFGVPVSGDDRLGAQLTIRHQPDQQCR